MVQDEYYFYILRDVRRFIAELFYYYMPSHEILPTEFGQYLYQQMLDANIRFPFRESYAGSTWISLKYYNLIYKIWEFLYFIRSRELYNIQHQSMVRIMSMVNDTIDVEEIEYIIYIIFRMKRVRKYHLYE